MNCPSKQYPACWLGCPERDVCPELADKQDDGLLTDIDIIQQLQLHQPDGFDWTPTNTELKKYQIIAKAQRDLIRQTEVEPLKARLDAINTKLTIENDALRFQVNANQARIREIIQKIEKSSQERYLTKISIKDYGWWQSLKASLEEK